MSFFSQPQLWILGAGQMGGAMISRWLDAGFPPERITVIDRNDAVRITYGARGVKVAAKIEEAGAPPAVIVLAIKPQYFAAQQETVCDALGKESVLVLSVMAGIRVAQLTQALGEHHVIVRAMPNTPCALGEGVSALFSSNISPAQREQVSALMRILGLCYWCDQEAHMLAATAISGSGPAYGYMFLQSLKEAAIANGFSAIEAHRVALQTLKGAVLLAEKTGDDFETLAARVTSKGGTTEAARAVLDDRLKALMQEAVAANKKRSIELSNLS